MNKSFIVKSIILATFYMFSVNNLLSQIQDFQEVIIYENKVEHAGVVNFMNALSLTKKIDFKDNTYTSEVTEYNPSQIDSFLFVKIGLFYRTLDHSYTTDDGVEIIEKRFGRQIFKGEELSVFRIDLDVDEYNVVLGKLPNYLYYVYDHTNKEQYKLDIYEKTEGFTKFKIIKSYEGVLRYMMRNWGEINNEINNLKYNDKSISRLFKKYHSNSGLKIDQEFTKEKRSKSVFLSIGYSPLALRENVSNNSGILFDARYTLFSRSKLLPDFQVGIEYMSIQYDHITESRIRNRYYTGFNQFRINIGARREFFRSLTSKLSVYGRINMAVGPKTYTNTVDEYERIRLPNGNDQYVFLGNFREDLGSGSLAISGGIGVRKNGLILELGMERISYDPDRGSYTPVIRIGYEYIFSPRK